MQQPARPGASRGLQGRVCCRPSRLLEPLFWGRGPFRTSLPALAPVVMCSSPLTHSPASFLEGGILVVRGSPRGSSRSGVSHRLASLGRTGRSVVLGCTYNT